MTITNKNIKVLYILPMIIHFFEQQVNRYKNNGFKPLLLSFNTV